MFHACPKGDRVLWLGPGEGRESRKGEAMKQSAFSRLLVAGSLVLAVAALSATAAFAAAPTVTPVASGLDNPRGLAFGPDGNLYVAEAGHGGTECVSGGPEGEACFGFTSQISRINGDKLAHADPHRPDLVGFARRLGCDRNRRHRLQGRRCARDHHRLAGRRSRRPASRPTTVDKAKHQIGHLIKAELNQVNDWDNVADVGHFDFQWTLDNKNLVPDQFPDANPYGVAVGPTATWVVDAGGEHARPDRQPGRTSRSPRSCRTRPRATRCRRVSRSAGRVRST